MIHANPGKIASADSDPENQIVLSSGKAFYNHQMNIRYASPPNLHRRNLSVGKYK
jgi:hypothetical protein